METFKDRLIYALNIRNMKASDLAKKTGISRPRISQYLNGIYTPKSKGTFEIANALNVDEKWLMGLDVPMDRQYSIGNTQNILPIEVKRIPLLGEIACGKPIFTNEDRESYILSGTEIKADFCLRCVGDSMIGARIYDGDIVFIREQPIVDNGEVAAVVIGDEATLKRWYYYPEKQKLVLNAENSKYEPLIYVGAELETVHCLGKAVAFQSDVL